MRAKTAQYSTRVLLLLFLSLFIVNCDSNESSSSGPDTPQNETVSFQIFYTNDEHGWMESSPPYIGAAGMYTKWVEDHGYSTTGNNLVLSGGDMWTGPAISTWFDGEPMVSVMNAMGYDAAAIGNHEFDFSQTGLRDNLTASQFPYLAANLKSTSGGYPDFVEPYIIKTVAGVDIGIIGITTSSAIAINFPDNVAGLQLISYEEALDEAAPQAIADGADVLILTTHIPSASINSIVPKAREYDIAFIGCGHSHAEHLSVQSDYMVVEASSNLTHYGYAEIEYDLTNEEVVSIAGSLHENTGSYTPDPTIQSRIQEWQSQLDDQLSDVIGYTESGVTRQSHPMYNMIIDSWLAMYADADIAMSNYGGVRAGIPAGDITLESVVGVLPFDNNIVKLDLTGSQVKSTLAVVGLFIGGVNVIDGYTMLDGSVMDDNTVYKVLITDYIYDTTDELQQYDPTPEVTGVNWRDPVIDWIRSLNTSSSDPLENYLDSTPRKNVPNMNFYL